MNMNKIPANKFYEKFINQKISVILFFTVYFS